MLRVDSALFHYFGAGRAQAELMEPDYLSIEADVLIPNLGDTGFNRDASAAFVRQNFFTVFLWLAIKAFKARQGDNAHAVPELLRSVRL